MLPLVNASRIASGEKLLNVSRLAARVTPASWHDAQRLL
jgi:hypothetical protein